MFAWISQESEKVQCVIDSGDEDNMEKNAQGYNNDQWGIGRGARMIDKGDKAKTPGCSTATSLRTQMRLQYSTSAPSDHLGKTGILSSNNTARLV